MPAETALLAGDEGVDMRESLCELESCDIKERTVRMRLVSKKKAKVTRLLVAEDKREKG